MSPKRRKRKKEKGKVKIFGIEISFNGIFAGKIVFMIVICILFLWHCFFNLKVAVEWAFPAFLLVIASFVITLNFGCLYHYRHE